VELHPPPLRHAQHQLTYFVTAPERNEDHEGLPVSGPWVCRVESTVAVTPHPHRGRLDRVRYRGLQRALQCGARSPDSRRGADLQLLGLRERLKRSTTWGQPGLGRSLWRPRTEIERLNARLSSQPS
jgi:hypothetical protein